jgi:hypothetical protein
VRDGLQPAAGNSEEARVRMKTLRQGPYVVFLHSETKIDDLKCGKVLDSETYANLVKGEIGELDCGIMFVSHMNSPVKFNSGGLK